MNLTEMTHVLALAQTFDQRTVGEADVLAWHSILSDVDYADARTAVTRHYDQHTERIMPAHIRRAVEQIELERARAARKWAPGQAGVPADSPMPELEKGWAAGGLLPDVQALVDEVRGRLAARSDADRAKLFPRQTYWEREHRAYLRAHDGKPNPLYKPGARGRAADEVTVDEFPQWKEVREGQPCPVCGKTIRGAWTITREVGKTTCEHESEGVRVLDE